MSMCKYLFVLPFLGATAALSAQFIERQGPYEINWTHSKIRFYGVSKLNEQDENYRAVGQRAWAKGLKLAEHNIPVLLSDKLGAVSSPNSNKLNQLAEMTLSVNTTYFGDQRVKVLLEAPIQKMTSQLVQVAQTATTPIIGTDATDVVIQLAGNAKPAVFTRIIDETGKDLLRATDLVAATQGGSPLNKWFKSDVDKSGAHAAAPVIMGQSTMRGVVSVKSSDWKPAYAAAFLNGKAAFVVK